MKKMKNFITFIGASLLAVSSAFAGVNITDYTNANSSDLMFMDMAVVTAQKAIKAGGQPTGAVLILNGVWRSGGTAKDGQSPEMVAVNTSRLNDFKDAVIYTVNEPTTDTYNQLAKAGVKAVYFSNPRQDVVKAGIYPSSAYDDSKAVESTMQMKRMSYSDAQTLIKK